MAPVKPKGLEVLLCLTARILSGSVVGIQGISVTVEVDLRRGLPSFDVVGLPGTAVKESRTRVRSAVINSGFALRPAKIVVNLAPADTRKEGPLFDLPIALGILSCMGEAAPNEILVVGELSLDGRIRAVKGVLPIVERARAQGIKEAIVPFDNSGEAALVKDMRVLPARTLREALFCYQSGTPAVKVSTSLREQRFAAYQDLSEIKGQLKSKRALEIAAAGGHNILLLGPPGGGKTMLASALPGILPDLAEQEKRDITRIYSVSGLLAENSVIASRPFRRPHHASSPSAILGGGSRICPGEISLAHLGVLFLDELAEFRRDVLEALRQPLEERRVIISRSAGRYVFPASVLLAAAANPCPCGYLGDGERECRCTPGQISRYRRRLSGPLLDRFDIIVEVPRLKGSEIFSNGEAEGSALVKKRVTDAITFSRQRNSRFGVQRNSELSHQAKEAYRVLPEAERLLSEAADRLCLSPRVIHKLLRVARTIADLAQEECIGADAAAEAVQLRRAEDFLYTTS